MRFLFYSHDGFGMGHTCRNLAIARSLNELAPRAAVLLATGSDDVTRLGVPDRVEVLKLPSIRKLANERYESRRLSVSGADVRYIRSQLLASAVESYRPHVLLVDKHPFGAGGELKDALAAMKRIGGRTVLGLRDILDAPETVRAEWAPHDLPGVIPAHYDSVLVYGQREMFDPAAVYGFPAELARRTHYCGYVINPEDDGEDCPEHAFHPRPPRGDRPFIVGTVGGGEDGMALMQNFIEASAGMDWRSVAVAGPMMPGLDRSRVEQLAHAEGVALHGFVPRLNRWFRGASAVVCMGGYNTLTQALAVGCPVVCVPRTEPRQEQLIRAMGFASRGLIRMVHPEELTPQRLQSEIRCALGIPRQSLWRVIQQTLQFDGAEMAAHRLLALARTARRQVRMRLSQS